MARPASPKRTLRRDIKARERNKAQKSTMKTFIKKFKSTLASGTPSEELFRKTQSLIARASRKKLIHPGKGSRMISRLMTKKVAAESPA